MYIYKYMCLHSSTHTHTHIYSPPSLSLCCPPLLSPSPRPLPLLSPSAVPPRCPPLRPLPPSSPFSLSLFSILLSLSVYFPSVYFCIFYLFTLPKNGLPKIEVLLNRESKKLWP